jgi:hypothetical protein
MLTTAQLALVKADILANPDMNSQPIGSDGADAIAKLYNLTAAPDFWAYRTAVKVDEIGDAIDATELVGLTTGKLTQLQTLLLFGAIDASKANRRTAFDQIFAAASGTLTRPALAIIWRRKATRIEKLLSTGTGSTATPATMGREGIVSYQDIELARAS